MPSDRSLRRKTYLLLALMVFFGSVGNTVLDKGMKALGALSLSSLAAVRSGFFATISSPTVWLGIACMIVFFVAHMLALSGGVPIQVGNETIGGVGSSGPVRI